MKHVSRFDFSEFEEWVNSHPTHTLESLGIGAKAAENYRQRGLNMDRADELANRAGRHPGEIWQAWWECEWMTDEEYAKTGRIFVKTKKCGQCSRIKHRSQFGRRAASKDGLSPDCKECARDSSRRSRKNAEVG